MCPLCGTTYHDEVLSFCPSDGTRLTSIHDASSLIGHLIAGRFRVEKLLGQGGMGAVYKAVQESVDREVAIKVLRPEAAENTVAIKRFLIEAKATSKLSNDHTITVFDHGQTSDGLLYIAMEYLEGITLRDKLAHCGALPYAAAVKIIDQVAQSLAEAHELDIIHRDLKPENIFLAVRPSDPEFVKVLDFGIARAQEFADGENLTKTGTVTGTPTYMSPEAVTGQKVNAAADVYAMGVIFYEMLTGQAPFVADTPFLVMQQHVTFEPPTLTELMSGDAVPQLLSHFVQRCLGKKPGNRPSDGAAFRRGLDLALSGSDTAPSITTFESDSPESMMGDTINAAPAIRRTTGHAPPQHTPPSPPSILQHDTVADTTNVFAVKPKRNPLRPVFWGGGVLAFILLGVWASGVLDDAPQAEVSKPVPAAAPARPQVTSPPATTSPKEAAPTVTQKREPLEGSMVSMMVDTTPRGAEAKRDGRVVGTTPFQLQVERGQDPIAIELSLEGYQVTTIEFIPIKSGHRSVALQTLSGAATRDSKSRARRAKDVKRSSERKRRPRKKKNKRIDDYLD